MHQSCNLTLSNNKWFLVHEEICKFSLIIEQPMTMSELHIVYVTSSIRFLSLLPFYRVMWSLERQRYESIQWDMIIIIDQANEWIIRFVCHQLSWFSRNQQQWDTCRRVVDRCCFPTTKSSISNIYWMLNIDVQLSNAWWSVRCFAICSKSNIRWSCSIVIDYRAVFVNRCSILLLIAVY
jgi:hypothetical protein